MHQTFKHSDPEGVEKEVFLSNSWAMSSNVAAPVMITWARISAQYYRHLFRRSNKDTGIFMSAYSVIRFANLLAATQSVVLSWA